MGHSYVPLTFERLLAACGEEADRSILRSVWELRKPCITLVRELVFEQPQPVENYLFGDAFLPPGLRWPTDGAGDDLMFLCHINLASLPPGEVSALLPESGYLSFFGNETALMDGGIDDSCAVVFTDASSLQEIPDDEFGLIADYPVCKLHALNDYSLPCASQWDYSQYGRAIEFGVDKILVARNTINASWRGLRIDESYPQHQMFGHLSDPQGMEVSENDHVLLQIHSDKFIGLSWGDAGTVFFSIDDDALKARDWTQVRLQLSCA